MAIQCGPLEKTMPETFMRGQPVPTGAYLNQPMVETPGQICFLLAHQTICTFPVIL